MTARQLKKAADILDEYLSHLSPVWYPRTIAIGRDIAKMMRTDAHKRIEELTRGKE